MSVNRQARELVSTVNPLREYEASAATPTILAQGAAADAKVHELVESHLPLVANLVDRTWLSPSLGLDREDLIAAGACGLLLAARRFDPGRGVRFGVFARQHVHGAILREIQKAMQAVGLGVDGVLVPPESADPEEVPSPQMDADRSALLREIRDFMEYRLPERERLMLILYYFEDLTLAEIARIVGMGEATVARTVKLAMKKLKATIDAKEKSK